MSRESEPNRSAIAFALACLLALGACGGGGSDSPTSPGRVADATDMALRSFDLVNTERRDAGVGPALDFNDALARVAREHSQDMRDRGYFGHRNSAGEGLVQRLGSAGIAYSAAAENIVKISTKGDPPRVAHDMLVASAEHRQNMLDQRFRVAGVGVAMAGDDYWFTQIFIRP